MYTQTIDDMIEIRQELSGVSNVKTLLERHQKRFMELIDQNNKCAMTYEHKWNAIEAAIEAQRTRTEHAMHVHEMRASTKMDSLAQTLLFMTRCMEKHSIIPAAPPNNNNIAAQ